MSTLTQAQKVNRYYESTVFDYHSFWTGRSDHAIHFGYFDTGRESHSESLLLMNRALAERVHISRNDRVLDAGCGYGGSALWLARNIGCSVVGLNIVPFQVEKARRYTRGSGLENLVTFQLEDYAHTSLPNDSFDVIWGLESIVHASDKRAVLAEAYRLLRSGGRMILAEYTLRDNPSLNSSERNFLSDWLDGWAMPSLLGAREYVKLFEEVGFKDVRAENITPHVLPSLKRLKKILRLLPVGKVLRKLGVINKEHLGNMEGSRVQIEALERGLWQYTVLTATKL